MLYLLSLALHIDFTQILPNIWRRLVTVRVRRWQIKRYKHRKIKSMRKDPEKNYYMQFRMAIRDKDELKSAETVFSITVPASGFFFAKKHLEKYVHANLDLEVLDFHVLEEDVNNEENS